MLGGYNELDAVSCRVWGVDVEGWQYNSGEVMSAGERRERGLTEVRQSEVRRRGVGQGVLSACGRG